MKTSHLLSIQKRGTRYVIVAQCPMLSRSIDGGVTVNRSPFASAPRPRIVGRYATEAEASYCLGALEQRLAIADR